MKTARPTFGIRVLLAALFVLGFGLTGLIVFDAEVTHWYVKPHGRASPTPASSADDLTLRQSVVLVLAPACDAPDQVTSGTGFVIEPGLLATNAHVIESSKGCETRLIVKDYLGREHHPAVEVRGEAGAGPNDLALLKIPDTTLPALKVTTEVFPEAQVGQQVFTFGFPKPGIASTTETAARSGDGRVSSFDSVKNLFITSGLPLYGGNSGGPVFRADDRTVVGIALAIPKQEIEATGIGYVIPAERLRAFFHDKLAKDLP